MEPVLPQPYPNQMRNLLLRLGDAFAEARGVPADAEDLRRRQARTRQRLQEALGLPLPTAPLAAEVTSVRERDGYRIENVRYQSQPDFWVTAALYVPTRLPLPAPGVICPHGHWKDGRYHPEVQRRMVGMAKRGYVVLSLDKVGYNDREPQGPHRSRNLFLTGGTVQGIQVWDNMRGIDYLCSRPEVDPGRIGCTGASGGGNQTMYVTALDERITASIPVCSVEMGECYLHKAFCTCETVPGLFTFADLVDIAGLAAPRPLLLIHGMLDNGFFLDSAQKAWRRLRRQYHLAGAEECLGHFLSYDGHAYNREMREAVYAWFDRWLLGKEPPYPPEEEFEIEAEPATTLKVVAGTLPGKGMLDLYSVASGQLPVASEGGTSPRLTTDHRQLTTVRERLDRVLVGPAEAPEGGVPGGWPLRTPLRPHVVGTDRVEVDGVPADRERLYIFSEPDVVVPMIYLQASQLQAPGSRLQGGSPNVEPGAWSLERVGRDVTIHLALEGKGSVPDEAIAADLKAGRGALLLDVRGTGETAPPGHTDDVWLSTVVLGRPIHGMRAWDTRRALDWLQARGERAGAPPVGAVALHAHGSGETGLVALLAAATDPRFASLTIDELLVSFRNQPHFGERGTWVIPHILEAGDIPDLIALVAPRPVTVQRWVRADGSATEGGRQ